MTSNFNLGWLHNFLATAPFPCPLLFDDHGGFGSINILIAKVYLYGFTRKGQKAIAVIFESIFVLFSKVIEYWILRQPTLFSHPCSQYYWLDQYPLGRKLDRSSLRNLISAEKDLGNWYQKGHHKTAQIYDFQRNSYLNPHL